MREFYVFLKGELKELFFNSMGVIYFFKRGGNYF